jgi:5-formyltetrahydrofolate cyclo-ligase
MMSDLKANKKELRTRFLLERRQLDKEVIAAGSDKICGFLREWEYYLRAKTIMLFLSMEDEPQMAGLIAHAWSMNKQVCVPHLRQTFGLMDAAAIESMKDLVHGRLGLLVPKPENLQLVDPAAIDVVVVPGVAFDISGNRLGMGAGYYDRFLPETVNAVRIGVCWQVQVERQLPAGQYDQRVHYVVTEEGIIRC